MIFPLKNSQDFNGFQFHSVNRLVSVIMFSEVHLRMFYANKYDIVITVTFPFSLHIAGGLVGVRWK